MDLSIIVVSYNTKKITLDCLASVIKNAKGIEYEIIVVDNASSDGSVEMLKNLKSKTSNLLLLRNKKNLGFGVANNLGMAEAKGRYILLLNSDTLIHDTVLGEAVKWMDSHEKVGVMSCKLLNKDDTTQEAGGYFPTLPRVFGWMIGRFIPGFDKLIKPFHPLNSQSGQDGGFFEKRHEQDWVKGAFMFVRHEVYDQIGGFDEDYFMYAEDVDLCYRAKQKGWEVFYEPKWAITHLGGASGKAGDHLLREYDGVKLFLKKNKPGWQLPIARLFMKMGAIIRKNLYARKGDAAMAEIYAKAFKIA